MPFALPRLAVCVYAVLNVVLVWANTHTVLDPGFSHCKECFFKGTPPSSLSEVGLEQRCHRQLTGRPFASLYNTGCQTTVYTALHLSQANGWGRGEQDKQDAEGQINEDSPVAIPALYTETIGETPSSSNSPLLKWDALTAGLIRSSVIPMCSKTSGEIYVQSGVGRFNECGGKKLWSAVCCAASNENDRFSVGLVEGGKVKIVSIKALEELIGVTGLFSGDCGGEGDHSSKFTSLTEQLNSIQTSSSEVQSETDVAKQTVPETSDLENEEVTSRHVNSEDQSYTSSLDSEMDLQESTNESSESVVLYVLSSTVSLLYTPFSPIVNRVINFPFQVGYVLKEDLCVLASVPVDSLTLVNNLGSGVSSGVSRVFNTLYETGEVTTCSLYSCVSLLVNSLLLVLQEGFVGVGTLVWDVLCLMMGTVCNGFTICKVVLGSICYQMLDYLYALCAELGHQMSTVGCGIGKLTWVSGKGVGNLLKMAGSVVFGVVGNTIENVQEAFEDSWGGSSVVELPEIQPPPEVHTPEVGGE